MILLDENILEGQRLVLEARGMRPRQIGLDLGRKGMKDEEIIPLLRSLRNPIFFTRDFGFYAPELRHRGYCIVVAHLGQGEVAAFARRFLRHSSFNTQAKRLGSVARISQTGVTWWVLKQQNERRVSWA